MNILPATEESLRNLRHYLHSRGWVPQRHANDRIEVFALFPPDHGSRDSIVLPKSSSLRDAGRLLNEAAELVAELEGCSPGSISDRVLRWDRDIIRSRFFKIHGDEDALPLGIAAQVIAGLKEFLGYAAYTHCNPAPYFDRAGPMSGKFADNCKFGHTFQGSFGLKIECPINIPPVLPMDGNVPAAPFERQVFDRVAVGLNNLRESVNSQTVAPLLEGYTDGFSANMCRTLAELYENADGRRIEYDLSWSPQLESPLETSWRALVFDGRAYDLANAAAAALEKSESIPDSLVEGRIVALKSDMPPGLDDQTQFEHVITMNWERERGQPVKVRISLSPEQYRAACDAHKNGKWIRLFGVPERLGKYWTLTKIRDFAVVG